MCSRDSRGGESPKLRKILHQPNYDEAVHLKKAEIRWTRRVERPREEYSEAIETEMLFCKFQGILNKLTEQKFRALAEQALRLEIDTVERLRGCIDKIFSNALEVPSICLSYAKLCKVMNPIKVEVQPEEGRPPESTSFKRMLLAKCQHDFEMDNNDELQRDLFLAESDVKQQEELSVKTRMRRNRNIQFIGQLFKLGMLSEAILHAIIIRLLKSTSDEEALECFVKLIKIVGKDLDTTVAKARIDTYFQRIADIIKAGKISTRIKFFLQDVQEMRDNNWVPRVRQDMEAGQSLPASKETQITANVGTRTK